jgi:glycosyltransferase involved in cell wall biosynthesis
METGAKMHVLILSQYFDPEPIRKPIELANELHQLGHKVSVITGLPNYPSGNLYPGYKIRFLNTTLENGIDITRTYEYPYHGKSALGRIINYISFMISAPFGLFRIRDIDVIYVWHPPLTVGIAAWLISLISGAPFVYDVQDIWPESVVVSGLVKSEKLINIMKMIERFVYRRAKSLIVVTKGARDNLIGKGVNEGKIKILPHITDDEIFKTINQSEVSKIRDRYNLNGKFVYMFAGNLGTVQGLDTIISAADLLRSEEQIVFIFVGDGSDGPRLKELTRSQNLEKKVIFIEQQPIEKIPTYLASSDVLFVHLKLSPLSNFVIPYKITAYLAVGKPVLMATGGAAGELIEEIGAGISIEPGDPYGMAQAIKDLSTKQKDVIKKMGEVGRNYFQSHLAKDVVIPMYEQVLKNVVKK